MKTFEQCKAIFVERLKEYLNGKSVLAVSKTLGIPQTTLNGWIRQETMPSMEYLVILAQKMNCSLDYLVGLEN